MKREDLLLPPGRLKRSARRQTFGVLDAIARSHEPTRAMLDQLESAYRSTGQFLAESPEFRDVLDEVHPQGSRAIGTTIRLTAHVEFDIDLVARMRAAAWQEYGRAGGQSKLLDHLNGALGRYGRIHELEVKRRCRCVSLLYSNDMHADITPVIDSPLYGPQFGETHGLVPDRELQRYMGTNPLGYRRWFDQIAKQYPILIAQLTLDSAEIRAADVVPLPEANEVFDRLLCRMIQVAKIHRNQWFLDKVDWAPTSIFLTTLIAKQYLALSRSPHVDELDLFNAVISSLPMAFEIRYLAGGTQEWWLLNPTTQNENVACRMNTPERQTGFRAWLAAFTADLVALAEGFEYGHGNDQTLAHVQKAYGKRSAIGLRSEIVQKALSNRAARTVAVVGVASIPAVATSRPHTFHGDD
jgi:hypothetical protein